MPCKTCGASEIDGNFYASNKSKCKECVKKSVRENRIANIEYYRSFDKMRASMPHRVKARLDYQSTDAYKASHTAANLRYLKSHPKRATARNILNAALRDKKITRLPCFVCGERSEAHHPDYDRPLDVVWLCNKHHREAHDLVKE